jgi:tRNA pseudouridine32 synthase/23S rRNA pseudouridine746 synthase
MIPILFQDRRFVVLNKPAGLAVHAGPGGRSSVEDFFPEISRRKDGPWLAHRLDADTAGCLVVALRKAALIAAQAEFAAGQAHKTYWAVVDGVPEADSGTITAPLLRRSDKSGWRMIVDVQGQTAETAWEVCGRGPGIAWVAFQPKTGRTHQIRAHAAQLGWPILGDPVYGKDASGGLHLLARAIRLDLDPAVVAAAPPPEHMLAALRSCGFRAGPRPDVPPAGV